MHFRLQCRVLGTHFLAPTFIMAAQITYFDPSSIYSYKYSLNIYFVPVTALGTRDTAINKIHSLDILK